MCCHVHKYWYPEAPHTAEHSAQALFVYTKTPNFAPCLFSHRHIACTGVMCFYTFVIIFLPNHLELLVLLFA